jgi:hypothetical protein
MASLCTQSDDKKRCNNTSDTDIFEENSYKKIKTVSGRVKVNALFSGEGKEGIHYFFNPHFDDPGPKTQGTNEGEYWGAKGVYKAYTAMKEEGISDEQIHLPLWFNEGVKNIITNEKKIEGDNEQNTFKKNMIDYRDWNMIVNLLKYDANVEDAKIWGQYSYPCGETLPGDYFDGDDMRKEVTFIGLYFDSDGGTSENETTGDLKYDGYLTRDKKLEKFDEMDREDRAVKIIDLNNLLESQAKFLRGFIVVKDLNNKVIFEDKKKILKNEPYLYVEGLCANKRGLGAAMLNNVINMGIKGYNGTKLAALTVVISYYWKLGFRFYDINDAQIIDTELQNYFNNYSNKFIGEGEEKKLNGTYPSIKHFINIRDNWPNSENRGKDTDGNYIFTIEDYHYDTLQNLIKNHPHINAGEHWNRRGKPRKDSDNTYTYNNITFKAYDDEAVGDMGYYMYLKNDGKKSSGKGGGKNSKKRTKKKARRRKRKRTKRKRRRRRKRTKKRRRRRTKKRR